MGLPSTTFSTGRTSGVLTKAIENGRAKQAIDINTFNNADYRTKLESFAVSGSLNSKSILKIQSEAQNAIAKGQDYKAFQKKLTPERLKNITSPEIVYKNAVNNAYHRARYESSQKIKAVKPYMEYVTYGDDRVRSNHAILNGKIARIDDPFWSINYPPNGHACRCVARSKSSGDLRREGKTAKTLDQIERETATQQRAAGVPSSKIVRPLADKGWRGSFKFGEPGSEPLVKLLKKYDSKTYVSYLSSKRNVNPSVFTQVRDIPIGKAFKARTQYEAEEYTRLNFARMSVYDGMEIQGMNSVISSLNKAFKENNLKRINLAHSIQLERGVLASANGSTLNLNPVYLKSDAQLKRKRGDRNTRPFRLNKKRLKKNLEAVNSEIKIVKTTLKKYKNKTGKRYNILRAELKRLQMQQLKLSGTELFKRELVGTTVKDTVNHEIGHILTAQKSREVWNASRTGSLSYFDTRNRYANNRYAKYNFNAWMNSQEHRTFRRKYLSQYSEETLNEYIAESFAQYKLGKKVHPSVKDFIERILIK